MNSVLAAALTAIAEDTARAEIDQRNRSVMAMVGAVESAGGGLTLPQVASATLLLDLQADTLALADGSPISSWQDQSGNGHHFTQSDPSKRPIKQTIAGYPIVLVDTENWDDYLESDNFADNLDAFACFGVRYNPGNFLIKTNIDVGYPQWKFTHQEVTIAQSEEIAISFKNVSITQNANTDYVICGEKLSNSLGHFYVNGDNSGEQTVSFGTVTNFSNAHSVTTTIDGTDSYVRAIMVYQITDLDNWATDRAAITAWLANRYGITLP